MSDTIVLIADDHPLFRAALREAVIQGVGAVHIQEAEDMGGLEKAAAENPEADLVLLDLRMPGTRRFSSLLYLRTRYPGMPVVVVSAADDGGVVRRAVDFGASGFISKSANLEDIGAAIRQVLEGGVSFPEIDTEPDEEAANQAAQLASLTPQQLRVLMMVGDGLLNKQIAYELEVSEATIKAHMTAIMRKLGIFSRTQAALIAQKLDVDELRIEDESGG